MNLQKIKECIRQNYIFYMIGAFTVLLLKLIYSRAGSDELTWILTPTARWVEILSGIAFVYESGTGYVNHSLKYIIASSCSGVQFMIITTAMLYFSFVHRMKKKGGFLAVSVLISYLLTIFINGLRIILAIYIPLYLKELSFYSNYLTPEKLHTLIGTVVYFSSLFLIYHMAGMILLKPDIEAKETGHTEYDQFPLSGNAFSSVIRKCIPPVFWYLAIVLGIPFFNRAYADGGGRFTEYATLIFSACLAVAGLFCLGAGLRRHIRAGRR